MQSIVAALTTHNLLEPIPEADVARKERTGSEKRAIARDVLPDMDPDSPLLESAKRRWPSDVFAPELDYMSSRTSTSTSGNGPRSWTVVPAAW